MACRDFHTALAFQRRSLLRAGALGALSFTAAGRALAASRAEPDLVVFNAKVHTVDPGLPKAQAVAIAGDRILAVGTDAEIRALATPRTRLLDARGMALLPGFIDCHLHPDGEVLLNDVLVGNPYDVEFVSIDTIVARLRERASHTPPGEWIRGYFFDDTKVTDKRSLTRADLDRVSTQHPVFVQHRGGHSMFFNSAAFALAGITRDTPDPAGGTIARNAKGEPDGRVTDNAVDLFYKDSVRPRMEVPPSLERASEAAAFMSKQFVRYGLTSVHHSGGSFAALRAIRAQGRLVHRANYESDPAMVDSLIAAGIGTGFGDEWLRIGATAEHMADGSFSERTMALSHPYRGSKPPYSGNIAESQDAADAWVERMLKAGIRPNIHANGDVGIDRALKAYERSAALIARTSLRPKITHCTYVNPDLIRRIKAIGATPQPFTSYLYYNSDKFAFYGEEMMRNCLAFRDFLDAGIPVAAGSDFSPGPFAPLLGIQGMVTRTGWDGKTWGENQRVTVSEAIRIYTLHGAMASDEGHLKGSITPGKLADFVLLEEDPHEVAQDRIRQIKVAATYTGGNEVFRA